MEQERSAPKGILGVILAGGRGLRLGGGEKSLVPLADRPLGAHVAARLAPQLPAGRLLLNANGPPGAYAAIGLPVVADADATRPGPLAGLSAVMQAAKRIAPDATWVLSAPTDTPFVPRDLVARFAIVAAEGGAEIVLGSSAGGLCQVCGLWSVTLLSGLAEALASGQNKVMWFVEQHRWAQVTFPPEAIGAELVDPFFNINTPADLKWAVELLRSKSS